MSNRIGRAYPRPEHRVRHASGTGAVGDGRRMIGLAAAVAAGTAVDVLRLRGARQRNIGRAAEPGRIDLTVFPSDPTLVDGKPLELLALGDSGMAGVGVERPKESLAAQIAARVTVSTGRPVRVVSRARAGARTHDVLVDQLAVDGRPDVVVLLVGTNDVIHLTRTRRLAEDTVNLLARLHLLDAPVVMTSLPEFGAMRAVPGGLRLVLQTRAVQVRRVHGRAAKNVHGVDLVDVEGILGREFVRDAALLSQDRFHPSPAGYSRIADVLAPAVTAAVESVNGTDGTGGSHGPSAWSPTWSSRGRAA